MHVDELLLARVALWRSLAYKRAWVERRTLTFNRIDMMYYYMECLLSAVNPSPYPLSDLDSMSNT